MAEYTCLRGSAPSALREILKCERAYICEVKFAHPDSFNDNKRLWKEGDKVPQVPFGVGVWYKKTHRLIPVGIVKKKRATMTVGEFKDKAKYPPTSMAVVMQNMMERMTRIYMWGPPADGDIIARCAMWVAADKDERQFLALIDKNYSDAFGLSYSELDMNAPVRFEDLSQWVSDWVKTTSASAANRRV